MTESRKVIDCRLVPSDKNCTLAISGSEDEVLEIATHHAITAHGHDDTPELREMLRSSMREPQGAAELY
jgi:hypothetical protein